MAGANAIRPYDVILKPFAFNLSALTFFYHLLRVPEHRFIIKVAIVAQ